MSSLRILVGICLVLVLLSCGGCITLSGVDGNPIDVQKSGVALFYVDDVVVSEEGAVLHALVKGSVYETGEDVSVFGTCLDGDDGVINGTYAVLSSWYPNGTVLFSNVSMVELQKGYYLYQGTMNVVQGTYLTEIRCQINGSDEFALAWGEWQNPAWVSKIGAINETVEDIVIQIGNAAYEINQSFEITWDMIESVNVTLGNVYTNLSQEIYVVGQIANDSVDRNDSYIVYLLNEIISGIPDGNTTLTWNETADPVIYYRNWDIEVEVYNSIGDVVTWPLVACYINTTNSPATTNQLMDHAINGVSKDYFWHKEKIKVQSGFTWNVNCVYN